MYDTLVQVPEMTTTTFTTRINLDLKKRLEQVADRDKRSASYMANLAIQNMVEEREATRDLVFVGLELAKAGHAISEEDIDQWLRDPEDAAFPSTKSS
jgi:predicted transcriptional regulator